jgi:hypothetical protein
VQPSSLDSSVSWRGVLNQLHYLARAVAPPITTTKSPTVGIYSFIRFISEDGDEEEEGGKRSFKKRKKNGNNAVVIYCLLLLQLEGAYLIHLI